MATRRRAQQAAAADARADLAPEEPGPTGRLRPVFPDPAPLAAHGPARVIAMCNQKGGVGKTTTTINLGAALAGFGRRVLLVDLDPQGALAVGLGVRPHQLERTVYDVLMSPDVGVRDVLLPTSVPGMDLLPSNIDLSAAEVQLVSEVGREQSLLRALEPVLPEYDVVLLDCQPSLGLLTVNALTAADGVIIPLECEYFALRGVALLEDTIRKVGSRLNPRLEVEGLLATMFDGRTLHSREVLERLVETFGDKVFHTVVHRTVRFPETTVAGQPITSYAPTSRGALAHVELARELLARTAARPARREAAAGSADLVAAGAAGAAAVAAAAVAPQTAAAPTDAPAATGAPAGRTATPRRRTASADGAATATRAAPRRTATAAPSGTGTARATRAGRAAPAAPAVPTATVVPAPAARVRAVAPAAARVRGAAPAAATAPTTAKTGKTAKAAPAPRTAKAAAGTTAAKAAPAPRSAKAAPAATSAPAAQAAPARRAAAPARATAAAPALPASRTVPTPGAAATGRSTAAARRPRGAGQ